MKHPYLQLLELESTGLPMVVATVTRTLGSTPQKPGSSAIFNSNGLITGTVGGGIVEGKILRLALQSIATGESGYIRFNLNREVLNGEDALCGGQIDILIDASPKSSVFREMKQCLDQKVPGVLVTTVRSSPGKTFIDRSWLTENFEASSIYPESLIMEVKKLIAGKEADQYCEFVHSNPESRTFLEPVFPLPRLMIVGAGHIGKALCHLAKLLDFEVTVMDDREEYANVENLPDADHILAGDIGILLSGIDLTPNDYVVIVSRGHKDDAKALRECIGGEAAYIGMIGSRNKVSQMREDFIRKGWAEPREWKDIHAPVGIDIHSKSVQEIAVSIAAQLIQVKNSKTGVYV